MAKLDKIIEESIAKPYEDKVRGLNLTPEEDKELRELYSRSTLPGRPFVLGAAGLILTDVFCAVHAFYAVAEKDDGALLWFFVFMLAQSAGLRLLSYRMRKAEKQLNDRIKEIQTQNLK